MWAFGSHASPPVLTFSREGHQAGVCGLHGIHWKERERPRQHCQPQVPRSQMRTGWGLGPRAEGGATTCPPRGAVPSVSGLPASRTPPVVHGGPARPQLGRGSAGSGFWRRGQDLTQAVTMKALPTPKVRGCGAWHPSLRRPGSKGRQDGRESVPDSEGLQTRHAHTPLYTRAHAHIHAQAHMHARTHTRVHTPRNPCTYIHIGFPLPNPAGIF